jgi:hypothetical protein
MPKNAADRLELANLCRQYKHDHLSAVGFYKAAFAAEPGLADDWRKAQRLDAARSAVLAAGKVSDRPRLAVPDRAQLRAQALTWLQADLKLLDNQARSGRSADVLLVLDRLLAWRRDPELADIRERTALAALPGTEQAAWRRLWADVAKLLDQMRASMTHTVVTGMLTETQPGQTHEFPVEAGKTYVFELSSSTFDAYLQQRDNQGNVLAENDDADPGSHDARLVVTPVKTSMVRLVATSYRQQGRGPYQLTICAVSGRNGDIFKQ